MSQGNNVYHLVRGALESTRHHVTQNLKCPTLEAPHIALRTSQFAIFWRNQPMSGPQTVIKIKKIKTFQNDRTIISTQTDVCPYQIRLSKCLNLPNFYIPIWYGASLLVWVALLQGAFSQTETHMHGAKVRHKIATKRKPAEKGGVHCPLVHTAL